MSLYGHPDAGGYWQIHSFDVILNLDFIEVEGWPSLFWNPETRVLIIAYVDDFKVAGPKAAVAKLWTELRKKIDLDPPKPASRFLGCEHITQKTKGGIEHFWHIRTS